jgi:hypothetical protein
MSRREMTVRLALAALLGVVTNVVIAFGLAWSPRASAPSSGVSFIVPSAGTGIVVNVTPVAGFGRDSVSVRVNPGLISETLGLQKLRDRAAEIERNSWHQVSTQELWTSSPAYFPQWAVSAALVSRLDPQRRAFAAGLPLRCFYGTASLSGNWREGLLAVDSTNPARAIPIIPIPLNLALNSLTYSIAWGVVLLAAPTARHRIRTRRGHCPLCDYDLHGNPASGCPECGWGRAVPAKT